MRTASGRRRAGRLQFRLGPQFQGRRRRIQHRQRTRVDHSGNGGASSGNQAKAGASTIGGGFGNLVSPDGGYGTIAGGQQNQITAAAGTNLNIATIGGGYNNVVAGRRHRGRRQQQYDRRFRRNGGGRQRQYRQRRRGNGAGWREQFGARQHQFRRGLSRQVVQ
ncbi:MAG: hypothetical protein IPM02_15490 [Betaproteobacteria bacterium]|nr:hypothetical protein [Betaproteobacteria bacterium]